jgi:hypothetical protein
MTRELQTQIVRVFEDHFPPNRAGQRPAWSREPYRSNFFNLFLLVNRTDRVTGDDLSELLQSEWMPGRPDLDSDDKTMIRNICRAWSEWLYARDKMLS